MNIITLSRPLLARKFYRVLRFPYLNCSNLPKEAELKTTEHPTYPEIGRIIDRATIQHLERLSLVDFANIQGIARLEEAIRFADQIRSVDTTGVEPLISVLEDYDLALREDSVTEGGVAELVLSNASITEDDYFVAPPGNVPLEPKANYEH